MPSHSARLAEIDRLFLCRIESNDMRTIHRSFLVQGRFFQHFPIGREARKPSRKHGHDGEQVSHEFLLWREGFAVENHDLGMMPLAAYFNVLIAKTYQPISMSN